MPEHSSITSREAVLSSLLAHAGLLIWVLLFPNIFSPAARPPTVRDPNVPIALEFLQPSDPPEERAVVPWGDSGEGLSSDPRPPSAPEPDNKDPYAAGNTPNRFAAPPIPPAPPAPTPGSAAASLTDERSGATESGAPGPDAEPEGEKVPAPDGSDGFLTPERPEGGRRGEGSGPGEGRRGSLKDALGEMALGLSGGQPLRFDNPTGGLSGPSGGLSFDSSDFNWGPYARKIYWIIWTNWTQGWPPAAWAGMQGTATVRFKIWRDGTISDIKLIRPSGTEAFDICATVALEASSPLPPLPVDFSKEFEGVTAQFLYNMRAPVK